MWIDNSAGLSEAALSGRNEAGPHAIALSSVARKVPFSRFTLPHARGVPMQGCHWPLTHISSANRNNSTGAAVVASCPVQSVTSWSDAFNNQQCGLYDNGARNEFSAVTKPVKTTCLVSFYLPPT